MVRKSKGNKSWEKTTTKEGREKRAAAQIELRKIENELHDKLTDVKDSLVK